MHSSKGSASWGLEDLAVFGSLVGAQIALAVIGVLAGNELAKGSNPLIFVVYSNGFGALTVAPFAFFLENKKRVKVSLSLLAQVLLLSLGGVCAAQALLLMGLRETSPSFASAMPNLAPAIIFVMAWTLGMEKVDIWCARSRCKIVGTVICVSGAMTMSFLHGPALSRLWSSPQAHPQNIIPSLLHEGNSDKTITGCIYLVSAVIILSWCMIIQGETMKKYPAPLTLTTMTALLGSIETAVLIIVLDKGVYTPSWFLNWTGIVTVIYGGIICNAICFTLQLWCLQKRGAVFVSTFSPISTVCSAILSCIFLDETLHLGSVVGVFLIFGGLYMVLWGKSKDGDKDKDRDIDIVEQQILSDEEEQLNNNAKIDHPHKRSTDIKIPLLH